MNEIYAKALKLLSRKNYFTAELEHKLSETYPGVRLPSVIRQLTEEGFLNDGRVFKGYVRWKLESGYGPYYIRERLYQRGVERSVPEIVEAALAEELDIDAIIASAIKKYRRTRKKMTDGEFARFCLNYLKGRGFDMSDSLKILKEEVTENESDFFEGC